MSFEAGQASLGTLQSASGDCLPSRVAGVYKAAQTLNDSNYLEVTVIVTQTGSYDIHTDTTNGYYYRGTGTFTTLGPNVVRLKGSGKPLVAGDDDFTVFYQASLCSVTVTVADGGASSGGSAIYTLQGSGGTCMNYALGSGTYTVGTALGSTNKVDIQVNVSTPGSWTLSTATVDGFSYSGSGTFTATGVQTITLLGSGTPATAGPQTFTVSAGSASCTFPVTVTGGSSGGPCATVQGTYTAGTALGASNKIVVTHTYAAAGTYNVSTNTVNGYSFGPGSIVVTAAQAGTSVSLTLNGTGTPVAAATNSLTINFGDATNCSFTVVVTAGGTTPTPNNDYFPTTANSWWSYYDGIDPTDSFITRNSYTTTLAGNSYSAFVSSDAGGAFDTSYYRKDAATGFYYNYLPTSAFDASFPITFSQPGLDILFLKQSLTTGATWNSDFNGTLTGPPPTPVVLRFKFTCTNANATITVNGNTFTNVYQITETAQLGVAGTFQDLGDSVDFYYVKGVGLVRVDDQGSFQDILHWNVL